MKKPLLIFSMNLNGLDRIENSYIFQYKTKKRLSQKGSLFNYMIINNIVFIKFHINLIVSRVYFVYLIHEKFKNQI
jgi:hypothetical protein